jgi:hypothetical protein
MFLLSQDLVEGYVIEGGDEMCVMRRHHTTHRIPGKMCGRSYQQRNGS